MLAKLARGGVNAVKGGFSKLKSVFKSVSSFISGTLQHAFGTLLANALQNAIQYVQRLGTAFIQFSMDSANAAMEFETSIVMLSNVAGNDKSIEELSAASLALGKDVSLVAVSAESAAEGLTELYKAGLDDITIFGSDGLEGVLSGANREMGAFKSVSDLAATSNLNFVQSSGLATTTLAIYAQGIEDSEDKAIFLTKSFDYMVASANSSRAEVSDFNEALKGVGPTANALKIPLNEVVDSISILADRGIKGATAGTQLRQMLSNMTRETDTVQTSLSNLNIDLWDLDGNFIGMESSMDKFNTAFYETGLKTVFVSDATEEQNKLFDDAIEQYDDATWALYKYNNGLEDLTPERIDELTDAQERASVVMDAYTEIGGKYVEVTRAMTDREVNDALLKVFGSRGRNTAAALLTDTTNAMYEQAIAAGDLELANKILADGVGYVSSSYEDLHEMQLEAVTLEEQVNKIIESTAGKREILDSLLETLKKSYGGVYQGMLGDIYSAFTPLLEDVLPGLLEKFDEWGVVLKELGEEYLPTLTGWIDDKFIPVMVTFVDWLLTDGIKSFIKFGKWVDLHIIDNLKKMYDWVTTDGKEMFDKLYGWIKTDGKEAFDKFSAWIKDPVLVNLNKWKDLLMGEGGLIEYLGALGDTLGEKVNDRLEDYGINADNAATASDSLITAIQTFIDESPPFIEFLISVAGFMFDIQVSINSLIIDGFEVLLDLLDGKGTTTFNTLSEETLPAMTDALDAISNSLREDGVIAAFMTLGDILAELVEEKFPGINEAVDTFVAEGIQRLVEEWGIFNDELTEYVFPVLAEAIILFENLWTIADLLLQKVDEYISGDTWGIWGSAVEEGTEPTNHLKDELQEIYDLLVKLGKWVAEKLEIMVQKMYTSFSSLLSPLQEANSYLEGIIAKLSGLNKFNGIDIGKSAKYSPSTMPDNVGTQTNTVNNYYTQSNTVHATTQATPSQLSSVFSNISLRSI